MGKYKRTYVAKFRSGNLLENGNKTRWNLPCGELLPSWVRTQSFAKNSLLHLSSASFLLKKHWIPATFGADNPRRPYTSYVSSTNHRISKQSLRQVSSNRMCQRYFSAWMRWALKRLPSPRPPLPHRLVTLLIIAPFAQATLGVVYLTITPCAPFARETGSHTELSEGSGRLYKKLV